MSPPPPPQASDKVKYFRATTTARIVPNSKTTPTRRKWSDWGECSVACVRTRHRLNCDDLVGNSSSPTQDSAEETSSNRKLRNRQVTTNAGEEEEEEEQEDYADQGDEDDGHDSCAQVDTARTFEQQACVGGQCKSADSQLPVALRPRARGSSLAHGNGYATSGELASSQALANNSRSLMINVAEPQIELVRHNATTTTTTMTSHRSSANAGGLGNWNVTPLIQLTLLIGALAALILLALLLALKLAARSNRKLKLTPGSYHWMLARQTRRKRANCCHLAAHSFAHICSLESDAAAAASTRTTRSVDEHARPLFTGLPPPHLAWRQAHPRAAQQQQQQLFVDAKGRHFALASPRAHLYLNEAAAGNYYATPLGDELHCDTREERALLTPRMRSLPEHLRNPSDEKPPPPPPGANEYESAQSSSTSSSSSLQSTTAQLVSSAAGDSFEQSPASSNLAHSAGSGEPPTRRHWFKDKAGSSASSGECRHLYEEIAHE